MREILRISPYSVQMQENTEQNNAEYQHFLRSAGLSNKKELQTQTLRSVTKKFIRNKTKMLMGIFVTTEWLHDIKYKTIFTRNGKHRHTGAANWFVLKKSEQSTDI